MQHGGTYSSCAGQSLSMRSNHLTGSRCIGKLIYRSMPLWWNQKYQCVVYTIVYPLLLTDDFLSFFFSILTLNNSCLDYSAEIALIPNFKGCIAEIEISGSLMLKIFIIWQFPVALSASLGFFLVSETGQFTYCTCLIFSFCCGGISTIPSCIPRHSNLFAFVHFLSDLSLGY